MIKWEEIRKEWETSQITLKALAEKYNVKLGTVKSRKSREGWNRVATNKKDATIKGASGKTKPTSNKRKKRSGNPNPVKKFTKRNTAARKHGLYSKYFTDTQKEIMEEFEEVSIADQLWMQIQIKFSAIIQLQRVMWVDSKDETLKELQSESSGMEGSSESYKVVYAYEQYESYIKAQARAMSEYRNLVKQFLEMTHDEDERKLKLELMQANINKTKAETKNEEIGDSRVVIINDKDAMRKAMKQNDSN